MRVGLSLGSGCRYIVCLMPKKIASNSALVGNGATLTDVCKLTGRYGRYVDAHIVPKAFYGEKGKIKQITSRTAERPKRVPIGQYDPGLVTGETETRFATWDTYGVRFLRREVGTWQALDNGPDNPGYIVTEFDYALLRLFFLSILWRATASPLVYPRPLLQGRDDELRRLVAEGQPGRPEQFAVRLIHYPDALAGLVMLPQDMAVDNAACAFSHFGKHDIIWSIEAPPPPIMPDLYLCPGHPWVVLARPWSETESKRMMLTCVARHPNAFGRQEA